MTAATQSAAEVNANLSEMVNSAVRNLLDEQPKSGYGIVHVFGEDFAVPTTAIDDVGDILRLCRFPAGAYLWFLRITSTDVDTNATPVLIWDLVVTDSSDTVKATLINDTTIGQAGTSDSLDEAEVGEFVGDYYLALKVATAAGTAAAGTVKVVLGFSIGMSNVAGANLNPRLTDAAL